MILKWHNHFVVIPNWTLIFRVSLPTPRAAQTDIGWYKQVGWHLQGSHRHCNNGVILHPVPPHTKYQSLCVDVSQNSKNVRAAKLEWSCEWLPFDVQLSENSSQPVFALFFQRVKQLSRSGSLVSSSFGFTTLWSAVLSTTLRAILRFPLVYRRMRWLRKLSIWHWCHLTRFYFIFRWFLGELVPSSARERRCQQNVFLHRYKQWNKLDKSKQQLCFLISLFCLCLRCQLHLVTIHVSSVQPFLNIVTLHNPKI